ncbi:MAG: hypothetical protein SF053_05055 [Bacteroidia bacterium]|nr:hypothetical protein [Bacteroidia bacterium]
MANPIRHIIPDELYEQLVRLKLLNRKVLRDFEIKRRYKELRQSGVKAGDAIEQLMAEYPYLQYDTVRKIVYSIKLPEELKGLFVA